MSGSKKTRVLIVDDSAVIRTVLEQELESFLLGIRPDGELLRQLRFLLLRLRFLRRQHRFLRRELRGGSVHHDPGGHSSVEGALESTTRLDDGAIAGEKLDESGVRLVGFHQGYSARCGHRTKNGNYSGG